jgi:hypothetical protein
MCHTMKMHHINNRVVDWKTLGKECDVGCQETACEKCGPEKVVLGGWLSIRDLQQCHS